MMDMIDMMDMIGMMAEIDIEIMNNSFNERTAGIFTAVLFYYEHDPIIISEWLIYL